MKKNIRLLIIALAILFVIPNVNAREFTIDDTNFTIEGIKINLYTMTYDNGDIKRSDLEKYVSRQPAKTINVDISKLSYHPKYKTISVNTSTDEWTVKKHLFWLFYHRFAGELSGFLQEGFTAWGYLLSA